MGEAEAGRPGAALGHVRDGTCVGRDGENGGKGKFGHKMQKNLMAQVVRGVAYGKEGRFKCDGVLGLEKPKR